jgi:hypothetical protein
VDWKAILDGSDLPFRVTDKTTNWIEYKRP